MKERIMRGLAPFVAGNLVGWAIQTAVRPKRGCGRGLDQRTRSSAAAVCTGAVRGIFSGMTLKRMDNVGVVVDDLAAAVAFFKELGLELEGEAQVEGRSVDRLIGLDGVLSDIAMIRTRTAMAVLS